jgi:hypothetical protein
MPMKFARIVFWAAGIWGVLILTPLFFIFNSIGRNDPPPITHPGFYYGFATVGLAFQLVFIVIATDPMRFRPVMIPAVFEKMSHAAAMITLYFQQRIHPADLVVAGVDFLFGLLFVMAFLKTRGNSPAR